MDQAELTAVRQCQAGEPQAFGLIYDRYVERVYRFLYYKTLHRETAEDLTSQTFLKAMEHMATYDPAKGELVSWLYRIAQNTFIDHYRTRKSTTDIDQAFHLSSGEDVGRATGARLELERVEQALQSLSQEQRDLVSMKLWQELSYQEIAELTGKTQGALKMALSRTLKQLRIQLPLALLLVWLFLHR